MPWLPELFTAPVMEEILDRRRRDALLAVPYFDGLLAGDPEPLIESFAGEPEVHDPVRGRVKGVAAFRDYVTETNAWLQDHRVSVEDVEHVILDQRGFEEVVLHLDTDRGAVDLPVAVVADRPDGRIDEVRVYFSTRPVDGRPTHRPPLLQPDPGLVVPDPVAAYLRASAAGDVDATVASFEPDAYVRDAVGGRHAHRGSDDLGAFYGRLFSEGGGISLEACVLVDDGRVCALEHDVVRSGTAPQAGLAVLARGQGGRLAAVRLYDDTDPLLRLGG